ncbi:MAG TPA: hypothetical protein VNG13_10045 [Mycobacteriales bacterium]|nr:hypothetical protein [Mycobacteriales bacterium]
MAPPIEPELTASWSPRPVLLAALWAGALALIAAAIFTDPAGRVLAGAGGILLIGEGARSRALRPTIALTRSGIWVVATWRRELLPWPEVTAVRAVTLGYLTRARALEIETVDRIIVLAGYRVGGDTPRVAAAIEAARPAS